MLKFAREELARKPGDSLTTAATALDLETTAGVKVESARSTTVPIGSPEPRVPVIPPPPVEPQGPSAQASVAPAPPATTPSATTVPPAPAPATSSPAGPALVQPVPAAPRKRSDIPILLGVGVLIVAILAGGYFARKHFTASRNVVSAPAAPAPAQSPQPAPATGPVGSLEIYAVPWGTVKTVSSVDGKTRIEVNQPTPLNLALAPGDYLVVIASPEGQEQWGNVTVSETNSARYQVVFRQIDVQEIIRGH